jgi:DNA-binding ferritin-like protein
VQLQATLAELLALTLVGKQLHWSVQGPQFLPVDRHLDELVVLVGSGWP